MGKDCAFFRKQNFFAVSYRTVSFAFAVLHVFAGFPLFLVAFLYEEFYGTIQFPKPLTPLPIRDSVVHS